MRSLALAALTMLMLLVIPKTPIASAASIATTDCRTIGPSGYLLLRPVNSIGTQLRGLIVVDPATHSHSGEVDVPLVDSAFPTALPGKALAISGSELYLIDASDLSATFISLDGKSAADLAPNPVQFRGTAGSRYMLLGSPSFDQVFLVDVEQGKATDLTALIPVPAPDSPVFLSFATIASDDAHVLAWDGRHIYLFDTANPVAAEQIDSDSFAFAPDFSPDGSELIYSTSDGPGSGSTLMLESIDGTASRVIRESEHALVTLWIPESRSLFVDERTEAGAAAGVTYVLDVDTGDLTSLMTYSGSLTVVQLSPDGNHALLGLEDMGGGDWSLADLTTGEITPLPQVAGGRALPGLYSDAEWSLLVPLGADTDPLSGPSYRGVNLVTGQVGRLLEQPDGMIFLLQPTLSPDGRRSLVIGQNESTQTLWVLDAAELQAKQIAEGPSVAAQFSPDSCYVAVTIESLIDGLSSYSVKVFSTETSKASTADDSVSSVELVTWID